ncbi:4-(cytidine 5'-diphospho)-2-C-methyl-D-erythritol kinase [uncultured Tateyamaria sp.]|uniref:4-(cytidine 5'-diphospho)-2-C-methyl-D-erythritol kinase n=1 Tax=uncultured Tateyamaria sp. TaxID=455651 RepID=UPI002621EFE2|nr:4-(cytidine 5'-diphospho)-2-C-methyl-D-erythritol kinase [uncultured Tateyamaria sp.]
MRSEAFAPAKINLTLHVTGQRADGYHLLDSLVVFADVGDRLWFDDSTSLNLKVTGRFAGGVPTDQRNLAWRAAEAADVTPHIRLEKNLPHGGGIGGGSADAAAVLRRFDAPQAAVDLGADVPVCLSDAPQRMRGIGEDLSDVPGVPALDIVLVTPGVSVHTPDVFRRLVRKDNDGMGVLPTWADRAAFLGWLNEQRNDLQAPACDTAPAISAALTALQGAELARMSGSGSTCFGIYPTGMAAAEAAGRIAKAQPSWWVCAAKTKGSLS